VNVNELLLRSSASCKKLVFDLGCITDVYEVCRVQSLASRHGNMKMYRRPNLGLTPTTPEDDSDAYALIRVEYTATSQALHPSTGNANVVDVFATQTVQIFDFFAASRLPQP
jgi:hypothetical protein